MQSSIRIAVSLALFTSAFASYSSSTKQRRLRDLCTLYPFPRVGRSSKNTWQVPLNDFFLDYEPVEKRQLYAFPRVGRGNGDGTVVLPGPPGLWFKTVPARRSGDNPGMWFGPRLGRSYKTKDEDYEPVEKRQLYAFPRVGRGNGDVTVVLPGPPGLWFKTVPARRSGDNPGMWFGPRLGRSYKTKDEDLTIQNKNDDSIEPELMEPVHEDGKKREIHSIHLH